MKHLARLAGFILGSTLLGLAGNASAAVINSKHDFSATSSGGNAFDGTGETCVFCHTPHMASADTKPLWNKTAPLTAGYTTYSSTTMDGTVSWTGSTSIACLSCHDGSQAIDNVINATGSGGYTATGADMTGNWTSTTGNVDTTTGKMLGYGDPNATNTSIAMLNNGATSLGDDHPIAIPYGGGGTPTTSTTDPDFRTTVANTSVLVAGVTHTIKTANIGGVNQVWFDRSDGGDISRIDTNEVRLYNVSGTYNVECASCHDPHSSNATFLRTANTQSTVCVTCHVK